jgi:hypothetical protein
MMPDPFLANVIEAVVYPLLFQQMVSVLTQVEWLATSGKK